MRGQAKIYYYIYYITTIIIHNSYFKSRYNLINLCSFFRQCYTKGFYKINDNLIISWDFDINRQNFTSILVTYFLTRTHG